MHAIKAGQGRAGQGRAGQGREGADLRGTGGGDVDLQARGWQPLILEGASLSSQQAHPGRGDLHHVAPHHVAAVQRLQPHTTVTSCHTT